MIHPNHITEPEIVKEAVAAAVMANDKFLKDADPSQAFVERPTGSVNPDGSIRVRVAVPFTNTDPRTPSVAGGLRVQTATIRACLAQQNEGFPFPSQK